MNVFILNTGRCGSTTFIKACQHITNFTCDHESRVTLLGDARLEYPADHIEADNRLSWFLGRLDRRYGADAIYVHLQRDRRKTAESFAERYSRGVIFAYRNAILMRLPADLDPLAVSLDYCDTVNSNIETFLKDKPLKMSFQLENARQDFERFWEYIGAQGDLDAALAEFNTRYNTSPAPARDKPAPLALRSLRKLGRLARKLPEFVRAA